MNKKIKTSLKKKSKSCKIMRRKNKSILIKQRQIQSCRLLGNLSDFKNQKFINLNKLNIHKIFKFLRKIMLNFKLWQVFN